MQGKWIGMAIFLSVNLLCVSIANGDDATKTAAVGKPAAKSADAIKGNGAKEADLGFKAGRIRLELMAAVGTPSGHRSRSGDFNVRTAVDYEIPVIEHMTVSPRLIPYMFLGEAGRDRNELSAFGFGFALRGYSDGKEQKGFFGELTGNLIGQTAHFDGNSGTFNFMEELGVGYMFKSNWHVVAKINHISNAGLAEHNAGLNSAGLGFGYSFKPGKKR